MVPAGVPATVLHRFKDKDKGDTCNDSALSACLHVGTHCDALLHFIPGEKDIAETSLEALIGPCNVISVPENEVLMADYFQHNTLPQTTRILFRGGGNTFLAPDAAEWLAKRKYSCLGIDSWSISTAGKGAQTHTPLFRAGTAIIEGLDLSNVKDGSYFLVAAPLKIKGADGAHCRAVLLEDI